MLSNTDLKAAVKTLLQTEWNLPVYLDEVIDGFEKPCFFVEVQVTTSPGTPGTVRKNVTLKITYYQETADETDKLAKAGTLQRLFLPYFRAGDRCLSPASSFVDITGDYTDVMTLDVAFDFFDDFTADGGGGETGPLMESVDMNYEKE